MLSTNILSGPTKCLQPQNGRHNKVKLHGDKQNGDKLHGDKLTAHPVNNTRKVVTGIIKQNGILHPRTASNCQVYLTRYLSMNFYGPQVTHSHRAIS